MMVQFFENRFGLPCCLAAILLLFGQSACVSAEQFQKLEDTVEALRVALQRFQTAEEERGRVAERSFRDIIAHQECPNDDVRKLVSACALGNSQCEPADIQRAVGMMLNMPHRMAYFRPGWPATKLPPERVAMLQTLIQGHARTVNTKILVLVLPSSDKDARAYAEADQLGRDYRDLLSRFVAQQRTDGQSPIRVIDPKIIGCEKGQELVRRYEALKNDRILSGEPSAKERRAVIWTFMVDC